MTMYTAWIIRAEGGDHLLQKLDIFSGGKGLNQSVALGRAGAEVYHAGAIGQDGDFLTDILRDAGVRTEYVRRLSSVRTGNAIIQRDSKGDNCIILYGGANQSIEKARWTRRLTSFQKEIFWFCRMRLTSFPILWSRRTKRDSGLC